MGFFYSSLLSVRDMETDSSDPSGVSPLTYDLLITLLALVLVGLASAAALFFLRRRRKAAQGAGLPFHNQPSETKGSQFSYRHSQGSASSSNLTAYPYQPPMSSGQEKGIYSVASSRTSRQNLPEIRIHFPEETDEAGTHHPARVVAVRVGENGGIGLEPVEDSLPPYQKDSADRFQSLDLERLGGLTEKEKSENS